MPEPETVISTEQSPPPAGARDNGLFAAPAVLPYRAPYDEPSGPTATDIFKGMAAVGLMLFSLAIALLILGLLAQQLSVPEGDGAPVAAPLAVTFLLLLVAWLSYRGARDCFTGAIRRSPVRPGNDKRPEA